MKTFLAVSGLIWWLLIAALLITVVIRALRKGDKS